ncbi:universal stress protein [Mangrovimonas spongiae]|uniref:Universal stress protein n=1 Tax=Mangrovimonas spongiae TaxID=2494697 RepID=A0A3R9NP65_9FLAO|nr:universal stress protein [Mangrovimonas spongiae]RSK40422.1 universal stress protein [Mangrovimonas spongiae]
MKTILLPTDFSENSWNAIVYTLQLFKNDTCTFHLLHTYTPVILQYDYESVGAAQFGLADAMKNTSEMQLKALVERIKGKFNNPKHTFLTSSAFNTLTLEIESLYKGNAIDMVAMGTKGASGVKGVLFGSNTVHVLNNAKCPVLAIPSDFSYEEPHEILFPSDYDVAFKESHIKSIIDIATMYGARVNILHVSYGEDLTEYQEQNRKKLEAFFTSVAHLFHEVKNKSVASAISDFQLKSRINLLVMLNNKHSFFENIFFKSKINQIGFHLNIPFLVIPSKV